MATQSTNPSGLEPAHRQTIDFHVRYIGARRSFDERNAPGRETLGQAKPQVLDFFKLKEGPANGGTKTYVFARDGIVLTDLNQMLGDLAQPRDVLKLDLLERFEQG